jgi:predicted RNase H-like nuclease
VPCRAAVRAEAIGVARELNRGELGRSLSEQSWGICRKIRVDDLLLGKPGPGAEVREVHPEVCFWALAGRSPMNHNKRQNGNFVPEAFLGASSHRPSRPSLRTASRTSSTVPATR